MKRSTKPVVCRLLPEPVIIPRRYCGCDHGAEHRVLVYEGSLELLFGARRVEGEPTVSRALAWRSSGKAWFGLLEGYRSVPTSLMLLEHDGKTQHGSMAIGVDLHEGGRLSMRLLDQHKAAIDAHFGCEVVGIDTRRTVRIERTQARK